MSNKKSISIFYRHCMEEIGTGIGYLKVSPIKSLLAFFTVIVWRKSEQV